MSECGCCTGIAFAKSIFWASPIHLSPRQPQEATALKLIWWLRFSYSPDPFFFSHTTAFCQPITTEKYSTLVPSLLAKCRYFETKVISDSLEMNHNLILIRTPADISKCLRGRCDLWVFPYYRVSLYRWTPLYFHLHSCFHLFIIYPSFTWSFSCFYYCYWSTPLFSYIDSLILQSLHHFFHYLFHHGTKKIKTQNRQYVPWVSMVLGRAAATVRRSSSSSSSGLGQADAMLAWSGIALCPYSMETPLGPLKQSLLWIDVSAWSRWRKLNGEVFTERPTYLFIVFLFFLWIQYHDTKYYHEQMGQLEVMER